MAGYKTWAVGEEVLAADLNSYLQSQAVARFPNAGTRTAQLPAPTLGQLTELDTAPGVIWYWTGSAWAIQPTAWESTYNTVTNLAVAANTTAQVDLPPVTLPFGGFVALDITVAVFPNVAATLSQECQLGVIAGIAGGAPSLTSYQKFSTHQTATVSQLWVQGRAVASWNSLPAGAFQPKLQFVANLAGGPAVNLQAVFGTVRLTAR
jgi:hypothetical protein